MHQKDTQEQIDSCGQATSLLQRSGQRPGRFRNGQHHADLAKGVTSFNLQDITDTWRLIDYGALLWMGIEAWLLSPPVSPGRGIGSSKYGCTAFKF